VDARKTFGDFTVSSGSPLLLTATSETGQPLQTGSASVFNHHLNANGGQRELRVDHERSENTEVKTPASRRRKCPSYVPGNQGARTATWEKVSLQRIPPFPFLFLGAAALNFLGLRLPPC
jgi:hypothetical protein